MMNLTFFNIIFIIVGGLIFLIFGFAIATMFNPKLRGKMLSNNIKAMKHMTDISKDDMTEMISNLGDVSVKARSNIINNNEEILRNMAIKEANIKKEAVKTTFGAIREGLSGENKSVFCKHCGAVIDSDSRFCKSCGKEQ